MRVLLVALLVAALAGCRKSELQREGRAEMQGHESPGDRLARKVRDRLAGDPYLDGGASIVVLVDGPRIILEGWVGSVNARTLAEADAATVPGVVSVDDQLLLRRTAAAPDAGATR